MSEYKCAKYIRLSHADDKTAESDSVVNQRRILDSYIESQPDIEPVCEMVDDGYSGILFDRPAFKEMMRRIENGEINCVIVKDLSRLGREYIETGRYLRSIFPAYGVRFIALNDNIDTLKDSGGDLLVSIKSVINDAYCRDISVKTRSALNTKREKGDYVGACPIYGYKKSEQNRNKLVIDEYAAGVVRDIFRMRTDGMSASKIAGSLNGSGILSPIEYKKNRGLPHPKGGYADKPGAKWSATTIIRILQDETYTGTLIQGRQGTLNYKIKDLLDRPQSEWIRTEDAHEAVISRHDFELAQRISRLDTRVAPDCESVYPFSGILICGCCGARMTRKTNTANGRQYHYYYCPTGKKNGCTDAHMLKESALTACVLQTIKAHIASIASIETIISGSGQQQAMETYAKQLDEQIKEAARRCDEISGFKAKLYESMIGGNITAIDFRRMRENYGHEQELLQNSINDLQSEKEALLSGNSDRLRWLGRFKDLETMTALDRRVVVGLIRSIRVISKTELKITFLYQDEYEQILALIRQGVA